MLTLGRSVFTPVFSSRLAPVFSRYVDLKRALGQRFYISSRTLQSLDRFLDNRGTLPRLHDMRHAFAVNALLRWYRAGVNVESKLPWLATYLGHGSVVATHYYLHFIEPLRSAASDRFAKHYGALVSPTLQSGRRCG
jgi:integrase